MLLGTNFSINSSSHWNPLVNPSSYVPTPKHKVSICKHLFNGYGQAKIFNSVESTAKIPACTLGPWRLRAEAAIWAGWRGGLATRDSSLEVE
jgi:hypothetical protein